MTRGIVGMEIVTPGDLTDLRFASVSDKNEGFTTGWTSTAAPAGYQRIGTSVNQREWRYQENDAGIGNIQLFVDTGDLDADISSITGSNGKLYLLYDQNDDGDLADATDLAVMYDDGTNGDVLASDGVYTTTVNMTTGMEFSFAQQSPAMPGGVSSNIRAWYDASTSVYGDLNGSTYESPVAGYGSWSNGSGGGSPAFQFGQSFVSESTGTFNSFSYNPTSSMVGINNVATIYICNGDVDYTTCSGAPTYTQSDITILGEDGSNNTTSWNHVRFATPFSVTKGSTYTVHINITS